MKPITEKLAVCTILAADNRLSSSTFLDSSGGLGFALFFIFIMEKSK